MVEKIYRGKIVDDNGTTEFIDMPQKEIELLQQSIDQGETQYNTDSVSLDLSSELVKAIESFIEKN